MADEDQQAGRDFAQEMEDFIARLAETRLPSTAEGPPEPHREGVDFSNFNNMPFSNFNNRPY
jgi:hypothetical protein